MILNGLGFSNKPMSLTPLFFQNRPLEILFREGVEAEDFNRFKLGRVLDRSHKYGTELLFSEVALMVCQQEQVDTCFNSEDSTSMSLSGTYLGEGDEETVQVTLGHSKDHRPDLKQVMLEMMVSQDGGIPLGGIPLGGIPLIGKALSGNASDNTVFKERSEQLIDSFKNSDTPRYLIADSKLYSEANAVNLKELVFITRIPNSIKRVGETIEQALDRPYAWRRLEDGRFMQRFKVNHYGIAQRWCVVSSETSRERAARQVDKRVAREAQSIEKQCFHLQARRFAHSDDAHQQAQALADKWKLHQLAGMEVIEHPKFAGKGRPKKGQQATAINYQIKLSYSKDEDKIAHRKAKDGHYIIASNADTKALSD